MKHKIQMWFLALILLGLNAFAGEPITPPGTNTPQRIISLAPSTTEILFRLGLAENLVGVTRYCDFPPAAAELPKVGGYVDPNYEAIVKLKPDLVILLTSHQEAGNHLSQLHIPTLTIPHKSIEDIHASIRCIGEACGKTREAEQLNSDMETRRQIVVRAVKNTTIPKVLVCIGRDTESGQLEGMYVAGQDKFYNELIALAGGTNVCGHAKTPFPQISAEGVVQLNPDVIIELISHINPEKKSTDAIKKQWDRLNFVKAVKENKVYLIQGTQSLRPGPRYVDFLEQLAQIIHPESFNKNQTNALSGADH